jgi:hypothetical protein
MTPARDSSKGELDLDTPTRERALRRAWSRSQRVSLQEAIGNPSLHNGSRLVGLLLDVIAEHMCQHFGVEDAARR